ncbi:MAG TPA: hypothetical protein VIY27_05725, partial [Myxococcota bacterium]
TPENRLVEAVTRPSIPLTLPPERRRTVEFDRDAAPILGGKCADGGCHSRAGPLRAGRSEVSPYLDRTARTSPLVWHLLGHWTARPWDAATAHRPDEPIPPDCSASATDDEKRTLIEWIDLGAH